MRTWNLPSAQAECRAYAVSTRRKGGVPDELQISQFGAVRFRAMVHSMKAKTSAASPARLSPSDRRSRRRRW
jgi:hypothetical protein